MGEVKLALRVAFRVALGVSSLGGEERNEGMAGYLTQLLLHRFCWEEVN